MQFDPFFYFYFFHLCSACLSQVDKCTTSSTAFHVPVRSQTRDVYKQGLLKNKRYKHHSSSLQLSWRQLQAKPVYISMN